MIHAHKRYNAFEELFIALHRALPVRSISTIHSPRSYSWCSFAIMANAFVEPVPSLRVKTCPGGRVLTPVTPSASSANSTASSHRFHRKRRWQNIVRVSWRKGEGCCNIGCLRSCFIQILGEARLCEVGCSIEFRIIGIEFLGRNTVVLSDYFCACWVSFPVCYLY